VNEARSFRLHNDHPLVWQTAWQASSRVDLAKRQLAVARSEWKGHVTATKGGRVRYVPMTVRLADALRQARSLKGLWA
jgi:hypothetical protein